MNSYIVVDARAENGAIHFLDTYGPTQSEITWTLWFNWSCRMRTEQAITRLPTVKRFFPTAQVWSEETARALAKKLKQLKP